MTNSAAFAKHTQQQTPPPTTNTNNNNGSGDFGKMSFTARITVFLLIPLSTGLLGLFSSYLQSTRPSDNNNTKVHEVDFDRDFVTPFLLGLAFVIIIGFQTGGFQRREKSYALSWPRARRVRKVRRERVIVEDEVEDDLDKKDK